MLYKAPHKSPKRGESRPTRAEVETLPGAAEPHIPSALSLSLSFSPRPLPTMTSRINISRLSHITYYHTDLDKIRVFNRDFGFGALNLHRGVPCS